MTSNGILLENYAEALSKAGLCRINISLDTIHPERYSILTGGGDINKVFKGIKAAQMAGLTPVKINCVIKENSNEGDALTVKNFCIENGLDVRFIHQMNLSEGSFSVVEGGSGGDCKHCNRLRVTSNAKIKPCLFSDIEYDIREIGIEKAFELALLSKPEIGSKNHINNFNNIGG
jgi:cyclic pyranopterin phosphate synthase